MPLTGYNLADDVLSMFYVVPKAELTGVRSDFVLRAIPIFFLFIFLEICVGGLRGVRVYRLKDFIASVFLGMVQQLTILTFKMVLLELAIGATYDWVYERYRVMEWSPTSWPTYVLALLGVDACYYLFHRFAHEWHAIWCAHVVHHSGEDYNLATALRQGALQLLNSWIFNIPLVSPGARCLRRPLPLSRLFLAFSCRLSWDSPWGPSSPTHS
jgi:sterol desaturase/sphingolipid hydroxylase (fatty acid hydroxylase superfamily)